MEVSGDVLRFNPDLPLDMDRRRMKIRHPHTSGRKRRPK
jgi:hypothetical protein